MDLLTIIKLSIKEIVSNKLRSLLTMLGVIIGVFSIIVLVSIGQGATATITADLEKGSNIVNINLFPKDPNKLMDYEDTMDYYEKFDVKSVSALLNSNGEVKYKDAKQSFPIKGADSNYIGLNDQKLSKGRFIAPLDIEYRQKVAVINNMMMETFFKGEDPIGKDIKINGEVYKVIGVAEDKEASMFMMSEEEVYIPITTMQRVMRKKGIDNIMIEAKSKDEVINLSEEIKKSLEKLYPPEDEYSRQFYIYTPEEILKEVNKTTRILTLMLGGIAGISLLVGGIGIMNIMFVSVTERTREIGIRKAIGAQRKNILLQFLIESSVVSGVGGIIGILLGIGVSSAVTKFTPLQTKVSIEIILLAFCFSLAVGVIFGIYPANKAAKLKPIDALRFE
ncbi:ABC transporter permease [Maledivibacter halophilus]|uniref:Putative ABC transport system permease protein n=1 Tax=Maledivibacter halophilus TaxID=36842 RepID=A0A1T5MDL3_9FIRM|nr:ABC transporter permease [Maledivibacter halophilus]SKC86331.1 putative ABC transport system permease protein [Maledivibacter halophilus]